MYNDLISVEHYRLHTVEDWPESPSREVTLAAIRSSLAGLLTAGSAAPPCSICLARERHQRSTLPLLRAA